MYVTIPCYCDHCGVVTRGKGPPKHARIFRFKIRCQHCYRWAYAID